MSAPGGSAPNGCLLPGGAPRGVLPGGCSRGSAPGGLLPGGVSALGGLPQTHPL